jgi:hypothetical protein
MPLADAIQGAKRPSQAITWTDGDGEVFDLSGATIAVRIRNVVTGVTFVSDGVFTLTSAANGTFRWDYGTNDVQSAGSYEVQFTATFGSSPTPARTLTVPWLVHQEI